uniref:PDS5 cohesin associated factor A n=1 Tax=Nothobranchius furzeri TaxID=105023 RepID=A0A8C6LM97_NOTFU
MEFPQQQKPAGDGKIIYPPGVKEITDKISNDEVVKRLKMVVKTYMDMDQDSEEEKQQYLGLALHLASEFFLRNPNKDVRLLVACCLADIFRIYAPEAPYTSHDKLKRLGGFQDSRRRYIKYRLFTIFLELKQSNNSHNQKVQMHMMDLMSSIIMEGDGVTQELLDTILINLIPAHKNLNKQAYDLAKTLLKRTVQTIETCIANFFNQVLVMGKSSVSDLSEHVFDLIQELFAIDPMLLTSVMPQLEFKLKVAGSKLGCGLSAFNDIHVPVRLECVKFASHCLMNHPDLARDLTEYLKVRSHDPEEAIRHDVIVTIINAGKKDLNLVNDQLLGFVRERTLDKRWRVRKEAMMGLAQLYKKYCLHHEAGKESALKISWIKDKLLHIYYQNSIDDKMFVFVIFASRALNEMWKCQNMLRGLVKELLDHHKLPASEANNTAMFGKLMSIAKNLPDAGKAQDFMKKFNQVLSEDEKLRVQLEMLISPTCSCKQAEICVREITRKLTFPKQPTNPFLEMVKFLLERIAPVHIDSEAISALVKLLNKSIEGTADDDEEGVTPDTAIRSGLELLKVLSFTHPTAFHSAETYESLLQCLKMEDDKVAEAAIQIFRNTGQKIETELQQIRSTLIPILHQKAKRGTPHQAKQAVHCIHAIFNNKEVQLAQIFEVHAIKLLVRWLLGMKNNQSKSANSTLRLLSAMLVSEGDLTEQKKISKSDMSRLRLAAGAAIMKLAQEQCYHEIITPEQFQLCGLVINDECYQVRQIFAQKLHVALVKLLLPLEYLAVFALCAKDPVKERRAHARQCLLKNISVRREYIKQNPVTQEKLISLLPEYVVPYMIHLLAHDPDFTKPHEYEQLKDIKECLWFMLEVLMTKNENNSHAFLRKMVENIKQTKDAQCPEDVKANEKLYIVCDVALFVIANKSTACHLDCQKEPVLPSKFFLVQDKDFKNDKEYLTAEMRQMLLTGKVNDQHWSVNLDTSYSSFQLMGSLIWNSSAAVVQEVERVVK